MRASSGPFAALALGLVLGLASCGGTSLSDSEQLRAVNVDRFRDILDDLQFHYPQARDRVVIVEELVAKMEGDGKARLAPPFLAQYLSRFPNDPYDAYYLLLIARQYEKSGEIELASLYFQKCLHTNADVVVQGESVHLQSIKRLLEYPIEAIKKVDLYGELLDHFSDRVDVGYVYYRQGQAYEQAGQYPAALRAYGKFLEHPEAVVPGKANEQERIREMVNMAGSARDWTRENLDQLIAEIKNALMQKDYAALLDLQAKVNFFSMAWLQDKTDYNSQANYDLRRFLLGADHVYFENRLEGNSNSQEAYLKTWGWSTYMPIWYLYFRRVDFPADPEVNGNWEWAGIYFGNSLQ